MVNKRLIFLAVFIFIISAFIPHIIFAQTGNGGVGISLESEIKNIEAVIARPGITALEKHSALVRLARLRQLSGDIEGAAKNWFEAAAAVPGRVDDDALLSCAYCLAAMGEWDRAITALEPLLAKSKRARFLDTSIKAIKNNDLSELGALADNPEYSEFKSEILFILWKTARGSSGDRWRQRLVSEFPHTPEGRLAAGEASSAVAIKTSPFWLFAGGLDSLPVTAGSVPAVIPAAAVTQTQPPVPQAIVTPPPAVSAGKFQTGIFGRQPNAQAQVTALRQAGFSPLIEQRIVNGNEMWAVVVPAGSDQAHTANALRTAGFETFLIR
ncbi:MAG: SPOR domain-containing protein [Treponema sp.]|nr:SPOR domain-containing protein [Treponema sp.]